MLQLVSSPTTTLPAGYTARPATLADADALAGLFNACSRALLGVDQHRADDWAREWQLPGADLATDTRVVMAPGGMLAAYNSVWATAPYWKLEHWGHVHPDHRGRGLGAWLMAWAEARMLAAVRLAAPEARVTALGWVNSLERSTHRLLRAWGHRVVRHNLRMVIDLEAPPPDPEWPAGVSVRTFVPGQDDRATLQTVHDCFRDSWGWVEMPFEEHLERWQQYRATDPDFDPSLWFLAMADGRIVGTALCQKATVEDPGLSWISTVGVLRPWRRHGVALALLQHSFAEIYRRGQRKAGLGVDADSLTGATRLYEKAGMRPDPQRQYQIWEKELRPGAELSTQALE